MAAGCSAHAGLVGSYGGDRVVLSHGQALDAAGCAGERREDQQEHQGEGELCALWHQQPMNSVASAAGQEPWLVRQLSVAVQ
jgi:hypothetical protein